MVTLHPVLNKTFHYWHVFVEGVRHGQLYAYRLDGPNDIAEGFRYNQNKVLIDPYSHGVVYEQCWYRCLDTSLTSPNDIADAGAGSRDSPRYELAPRSVAVLIAKPA